MIPKLAMNGKDWKTLSSKIVYGNSFLRIREDDVVRPNGVRAPYYVLERQPFSIIIPLTKKDETYLVCQYRYPVKRYSWEFPMGNADGRSALETAKAELKEETGLKAKKYHQIGSFFVANGHSNQRAHVFIAQQLVEGKAEPEQNEFLEVKKMPIKKVGEMISKAEILDAPTIVAYHLLENFQPTPGVG